MGCHFLLQGNVLTQGSNPGLLHYRQLLYWLSYQGSSRWHVGYSSLTMDWTQAPCIGIVRRPQPLDHQGSPSLYYFIIIPLPNRSSQRNCRRDRGKTERKWYRRNKGECIEKKWVWCYSYLVLEHISHCHHILMTYSWKVQSLPCFPHLCEVRICMDHSVVFQSKLFSEVKCRILTINDYFNSQIKWHSVISMCWLSLFANQHISFYSQSFVTKGDFLKMIFEPIKSLQIKIFTFQKCNINIKIPSSCIFQSG